MKEKLNMTYWAFIKLGLGQERFVGITTDLWNEEKFLALH